MAPYDPRFLAIMQRASDLRIPVLIHQGTTFCANVSLEISNPVQLQPLALQFPKLKVVIAHMGHPWINETLVLIRKNRNMFADISALYYRPWQFYNALVAAMEYGVLDRLSLGSDYPFTTPQSTMDALRLFNNITEGTRLPRIPDSQLEAMIHRNTLELLEIEALIRTLLLFVLSSAVLAGQTRESTAHALFGQSGAPIEIDHIALGQGGLSADPILDSRAAEIRALHPRIIRLFVQEYFNLLPPRGKYNFETLDQSVDLIRRTGATPLLAIAIKPAVLFPKIDQDIVEPNDYAAWDALIFELVRHYKQRGSGIQYWEVGNEGDIGEPGGCPFRFTPKNYVRLYQHTAAAVKRADPRAKVGGGSRLLEISAAACADGTLREGRQSARFRFLAHIQQRSNGDTRHH